MREGTRGGRFVLRMRACPVRAKLGAWWYLRPQEEMQEEMQERTGSTLRTSVTGGARVKAWAVTIDTCSESKG